MKKTIILAVPYMYGLDQCIEKNLRFLGFEVINLCYDDRDSYYPNLGSRLKNLYHKHITKDGNYKKYLKYSRHLDDIQQKLASLNGKKADYALCIRANIYPKEIIATIREYSNVCVNYQWDGVGRFPDIIEYLDYFDQCWVFDPDDIQKYPQCCFKATTNFYFDFPVAAMNSDAKSKPNALSKKLNASIYPWISISTAKMTGPKKPSDTTASAISTAAASSALKKTSAKYKVAVRSSILHNSNITAYHSVSLMRCVSIKN